MRVPGLNCTTKGSGSFSIPIRSTGCHGHPAKRITFLPAEKGRDTRSNSEHTLIKAFETHENDFAYVDTYAKIYSQGHFNTVLKTSQTHASRVMWGGLGQREEEGEKAVSALPSAMASFHCQLHKPGGTEVEWVGVGSNPSSPIQFIL